MEFFNFGLEQKLDQHFCVEFHSDSDGDGLKPKNRQLTSDSNWPLLTLIAPEFTIINSVCNQKVSF